MTQTLWNDDAMPVSAPIQKVLYDLRTVDQDNLLLDSVSMADLYADPDVKAMPTALLDALVVPVNKLSLKMGVLERAMNALGVNLTVKGAEIGGAVRLRGVMQVPVLFPLSDGQAVIVWFHNPDTTPNKLTPLDELVSWKWMLNKKDITIVVAPERGKDLNIREVARRVMRLAERNMVAFAKANTKLAERIAEEQALDTEIVVLEKHYGSLMNKLDIARERKIESERANPTGLIEPPEPEPFVGPSTYTLNGRTFQVAASFPDNEAGTADANAFMLANPGTGVLAVENGIIIVAPNSDMGVVVEPVVVDPTPDRSGTPEERAAADQALAMAAGVVAELGGTFADDGYSLTGTAGAWAYGNASLHGQTVRLAGSAGGVVQVDRKPHGADGELILSADQVRAALLAAAPAPVAEPEPAPVVEPESAAFPLSDDEIAAHAVRQEASPELVRWRAQNVINEGKDAREEMEATSVRSEERRAKLEAIVAEATGLAGSIVVRDGAVYQRVLSDLNGAMAPAGIKPAFEFPEINKMIWEQWIADANAPYAKTAIEAAIAGGKAVEGWPAADPEPVAPEPVPVAPEPAVAPEPEPVAPEPQPEPEPVVEPAAIAPIVPTAPSKIEWEEAVFFAMSEQGDMSTSDAQGIADAHGVVLMQQYDAGATPEAAAAAVLAASVVPEPEPLVAAEITPVVEPVAPAAENPEDAAALPDPLTADPSPMDVPPLAAETPTPTEPAIDSTADRAYLESLIDGSGDLMADDVFERMEPMFAKYEADADMTALLERAATAYGDAAVAAAMDALKTPA